MVACAFLGYLLTLLWAVSLVGVLLAVVDLTALSLLALLLVPRYEFRQRLEIPMRAWWRVNAAEVTSAWVGVGVGWAIGAGWVPW